MASSLRLDRARALEEAFLRYGLRYQLVGGVRFYQRREVKDALAWLRALRNDRDAAAFERIINVPPRGIGNRTIEVLRELTEASGGDLQMSAEFCKRPRLPPKSVSVKRSIGASGRLSKKASTPPFLVGPIRPSTTMRIEPE